MALFSTIFGAIASFFYLYTNSLPDDYFAPAVISAYHESIEDSSSSAMLAIDQSTSVKQSKSIINTTPEQWTKVKLQVSGHEIIDHQKDLATFKETDPVPVDKKLHVPLKIDPTKGIPLPDSRLPSAWDSRSKLFDKADKTRRISGTLSELNIDSYLSRLTKLSRQDADQPNILLAQSQSRNMDLLLGVFMAIHEQMSRRCDLVSRLHNSISVSLKPLFEWKNNWPEHAPEFCKFIEEYPHRVISNTVYFTTSYAIQMVQDLDPITYAWEYIGNVFAIDQKLPASTYMTKCNSILDKGSEDSRLPSCVREVFRWALWEKEPCENAKKRLEDHFYQFKQDYFEIDKAYRKEMHDKDIWQRCQRSHAVNEGKGTWLKNYFAALDSKCLPVQ